MESFKDWLSVIVVFIAGGAAWGDSVRRNKNNKDRIDELKNRQDHHEERCTAFITTPQHDKMQHDCQRLILTKIEGLGALMNSRMDNLDKRVEEIHREIKNGR